MTSSKLTNDMAYGQVQMIVTTPDADMKENVDYLLGKLGIAYRRRRFRINTYREISIRNSRKSGAKTERQKILDGECKSLLFIWEFSDAYVVCTLSDIFRALRDNVGYVQDNDDGTTSAYYIPLNKLPHIQLPMPP